MCCLGQILLLTSSEINKIINHLNEKSKDQWDTFIYDLLCYNNLLTEFDENMYESCKEGIEWFWAPFQFEEMNEAILVKTYTIYSMPTTGRCKLLNPIDSSCFIYQARPVVCRFYPFTHDVDENGVFRVKIGMENCPGYGSGTTINQTEIIEMTEKNLLEITKDAKNYRKIIEKKGFTKIQTKKLKKKITKKQVEQKIREFHESWRQSYFFGKKGEMKSIFSKDKKIIEPLVELGEIPFNPILKKFNEIFGKK